MSIAKDPVLMSELIDAHVRHLRAGGMSPHTIDDRARLLRQLHAFLPFGLGFASTDELNDFLASDPTWSAWTRATYAMHARGFYRWAAGRLLEVDPTIDMARPRHPDSIPNPVTDAELQRALALAPEPWLTVITLAAYAGLRAAEAADVHREDVTEERIRIRRAKGGSAAAVDTHPVVWELVRGRPLGRLSTRAGRWFTSNERRIFDGLGLPGVTLHRFRHWFGTALLDSCGNLRTVQEAMRHRSIVSTQGYTRVGGGQRRLAIRSLPDPTGTQESDQ